MDIETKVDLWRTMVRCRLFEEKVAEVFLEGKQLLCGKEAM